jgi:cytochrome c556
MKRVLLGSVLVCLAASVASATEDPIATRKKLMDANGAAAGAAVGMIKGEIPFDAKVAMAALQAFNSVSYAYGDYFPEGSDKGDTNASPKIWTDRAGFEKILGQFRADTEAAVKAKPQDLDAFKGLMNTIGKDCGDCHETYRLKKG